MGVNGNQIEQKVEMNAGSGQRHGLIGLTGRARRAQEIKSRDGKIQKSCVFCVLCFVACFCQSGKAL